MRNQREDNNMSRTASATVSANTLFHFTEKLDYLLGILKNSFYPRYCLEDHSAFFQDENNKDSERAIPMVCFCDIPLSNIRNHVEVYGEYAIGLKKEWGKENKISPVMYFLENSTSVEMIKRCFEITYKKIHECNTLNKNTKIPLHQRSDNSRRISSLSYDLAGIHNGLIQAVGFTKQYSGTFKRNGIEHSDVCFYNEREWRYMPDILTLPTESFFMEKKDFLDNSRKLTGNSNFEDGKYSLKFTPKDVKYIILSKEEEIPSMIDKIEAIGTCKYRTEDIELLKTRLISMEQILQDF